MPPKTHLPDGRPVDGVTILKGIRPLRARYATPPPSNDLVWLETAHFQPEPRETVLLAWPRTEGFTFRTGRHNGNVWLLSDDTQPREKPTFFATLK